MTAAAFGKKVVILGAGFGGLFAALEFEKTCRHMPGVEVTLVDRNNFHLFVPLLFHVPAGGLEPGNICFPVRGILKRGGTAKPVHFFEADVTSIDLEKKKVFADRAELDYDYLILALGSVANYYGIPGLDRSVVPLKTIMDGVNMHNRVLESFERALLECNAARRKELLTFVVVGGGPTGVELACMLSTFIFQTLVRDFPPIVREARVVLMEAADGLLHGMRPEMGRSAEVRLKELGVEVMLQCHVTSATPEGIQTADGATIASRNVIWVAGVKPSPLAAGLPVEKAKDGRIMVDRSLQSVSAHGLYVVGDCAYALQPGMDKPYPPAAQVAMRAGPACARSISAAILGLTTCNFDYKFRGEIVFLGRNHAVGDIFGKVVSGWPAFMMYQTYFLNQLMGFRNKLGTLIDWSYDYFYRRNTCKLD